METDPDPGAVRSGSETQLAISPPSGGSRSKDYGNWEGNNVGTSLSHRSITWREPGGVGGAAARQYPGSLIW